MASCIGCTSGSPKKVLAIELVQSGADPDLKDGADVTALAEAERSGQADLLRDVAVPKRKPKAKARGKPGNAS